MANAMSANTPNANKMVFFVALLMPYASHLCTFVWIVYHADGKRQHSFTPFAGRIEPDDGLWTKNNCKPYPIGGGRRER